MDKEQFLHLVEKYLANKISPEEEETLLRYYNSFQENTEIDTVATDITKNNIRKNIQDQIKKEKTKGWLSKEILKYAAIALILLGAGYFYTSQIQNTDHNTDSIPGSNAITLEMENGKTKIISEDLTTEIKNNEGAIVANQKGNQLIYDNETNLKELVYNTLTVPYGKKFKLQLSDGTQAHLNAGSSLKYPVTFLKGMERKVYLTGEVFLEVQKDTVRPFIVHADNLNIQVLGTKFNVSAYPEDELTEVVLVEGSVELSATNITDTTKVLLRPSYKGSYNKEANKIDTQEVITDLYTSWMNNELVFRNMTFENILKKLERHYNVTIVNNNQKLSYERFNASFGNEPLIKVLDNLRLTYGINFKINGDQITIN